MTRRERHAALRRLLREKGWNCAEVARMLDVHPVTVRLWHCGRDPVPPRRLEQLRDWKR